MANPPDDNSKVSNIVFFIQKMLDKHIEGKVSSDAWERYEMMELGFDPNKPKDVEKYKEFIDSTFKEFVRATSENPDTLTDYLYEPGDDDDAPSDDEDYEKDIEFIPEFKLDDDEDEEEEDK